MIYVPLLASQAEPLSRALYQIQRPTHLRNPRDVSTFYCAWHNYQGSSPSQWDGFAVLELPEDEQVPIHLEAEDDLLVSTLGEFVTQGSLAQQELDGIVAAIQAYAGQRIAISAFVPPSWQPYILTREQAEAIGFLPVVEEENNNPI